MSDLTSELNLALADDDDDTADYLVTSQGLRGSLLTVRSTPLRWRRSTAWM
jgi:hypothetical protein